jgi:hypothetical protein
MLRGSLHPVYTCTNGDGGFKSKEMVDVDWRH